VLTRQITNNPHPARELADFDSSFVLSNVRRKGVELHKVGVTDNTALSNNGSKYSLFVVLAAALFQKSPKLT